MLADMQDKKNNWLQAVDIEAFVAFDKAQRVDFEHVNFGALQTQKIDYIVLEEHLA